VLEALATLLLRHRPKSRGQRSVSRLEREAVLSENRGLAPRAGAPLARAAVGRGRDPTATCFTKGGCTAGSNPRGARPRSQRSLLRGCRAGGRPRACRLYRSGLRHSRGSRCRLSANRWMASVGRDRDAPARCCDRGVSSEQRVGRLGEIGLGGTRRKLRSKVQGLRRRYLCGAMLGAGELRVMRRCVRSATLTMSLP